MPIFGWFARSGQQWILSAWVGGSIFGMLLVPVILFAPQPWTFIAVAAEMLLIPIPFLPLLARCRVCGLHIESSGAARSMTRAERLGWIRTLQACPQCGDDGTATAAARHAWLISGRASEAPYWSRIGTAIVLAALVVIGGFVVGYARGLRRAP